MVGNPFRFALNLSKAWPITKGNRVFSPISIQAAMLGPAIGARGDTLAELQTALCFEGADDIAMAQWLVDLSLMVRGVQDVTLAVANGLFLQDGFPFDQRYLALVRKYAGVNFVDFMRDPQAARERVNAFIADHTNQLIQGLLGPGAVDATVRMLIANAVYFKGPWLSKFPVYQTRDRDFFVAPGQPVKVQMMFQQGRFSLEEKAYGQVLRLPYLDESLTMIVILPPRGVALLDVESHLTADELESVVTGYSVPESVRVYMPKHLLRQTPLNLIPVLKTLGVRTAFTSRANFAGIERSESLYLSGVHHAAHFQSDEFGSEGGAGTVASTSMKGGLDGDPAVVMMDRPFLFMVASRSPEYIFFIGRVADPTKN